MSVQYGLITWDGVNLRGRQIAKEEIMSPNFKQMFEDMETKPSAITSG